MKRHKLQLFHVTLYISVGDEHDKMLRTMRLDDDGSLQARSDAVTYYQDVAPGSVGVWIDQRVVDRLHTEPAGVVGVLAHEALHVADAVFTHIRQDAPADEVSACLVGHVAEQLWLAAEAAAQPVSD